MAVDDSAVGNSSNAGTMETVVIVDGHVGKAKYRCGVKKVG